MINIALILVRLKEGTDRIKIVTAAKKSKISVNIPGVLGIYITTKSSGWIAMD